MRGLDEAKPVFDLLAVVVFDPAYQVEHAFLIPFDVVREHARYRAHSNGWQLRVTAEIVLGRPLLVVPRHLSITGGLELRFRPVKPRIISR